MSTERASATDTRERLLRAAEDLLVEAESEAAVSVRALERHAGVTAPTIYRYFPDMGALLAEVAGRQFARLEEALAAAAGTDLSPEEQIQAYERAFARFGLEHPHEYRVLFLNRVSDTGPAADRVRRAASYHRVVEVVRRSIADGTLASDEDADEIASLLIMSLHGVISMLIARPGGWADADRLVERMMHAIGYGIVPR